VLLEDYLRQASVSYDPMDDLLTSPVLRDPEFASAVHWWVEYWTAYATEWFPGFLTRMASRGSAVDSALASRGFPPSLRYLPLIESGYDPGVTSRSGAVGLWQLMPTTARGLGLAVAPLDDERRHEEKSTEAALEYLDELYSEFGSWFLVLAAYNTGPTRVRSILRRHAPQEPLSDSLFWALRHRFPAETRDFVPKLYGAMWVASRPEAYGYEALQTTPESWPMVSAGAVP
jgi:membrane-bound lytic murein transglycosylase D